MILEILNSLFYFTLKFSSTNPLLGNLRFSNFFVWNVLKHFSYHLGEVNVNNLYFRKGVYNK